MFSIIVAKAKNGVIGKGNEIPWYLPDDFKHFAKITKGHTVVMGRKTHESIIKRLGKPLPERKSVVVTTQNDLLAPDCIVVTSIYEAIKLFPENKEEVFIIGGSTIYDQFMPLVDKLYITEVNKDFDGDTLFPEFDEKEWELISKEHHPIDEKHEHEFHYIELIRKNK